VTKGADFKEFSAPTKPRSRFIAWMERVTDDNGKTYETRRLAIAERLYTPSWRSRSAGTRS